jgi:hypothetical protein
LPTNEVKVIVNNHEQDDSLHSLTKRVDKLEVFVGIENSEASRSKRSRGGGDRACWFRIREADYPTSEKWCIPGGVFGMYVDGVGPLRSKKEEKDNYLSVVVYSTDPDTEEAHPNPQQYDHFVRVVMVCTSLPQ